MNHRRDFFSRISALSAGLFVGRDVSAAATRAAVPVAVTTLDVSDLPFTLDGNVKVFHLIAEPVKQVILPGRMGKTCDLWGFNGSAPGPTIQANEGDRVRIVFDNHLPEPTGIHWHGLELPVDMDGVPGIGQPAVLPGERFVYEFSLHQNGTFFYHPHMAMQEMVGMLGGFIIHPRTAHLPLVDRDYLIALQEYAVLPNSTIPNSTNMEFNWLTFNGKAGPASTPLLIRQGERVRIRLINMGMDHHPIHLHGFTFWETGREGARQQESAWVRGNTALVGVAQAKDIEFVADRLGDWMLHCHLPHHMMNQMATNLNGSQITNGPLTPAAGMDHSMMDHSAMDHAAMDHSAMNHGAASSPAKPRLAPNAAQIPLFPQDAFMESPMMAMDESVAKPETDGLPAGWSGYAGGMMTLVRVLSAARYAEIMALKARTPEARVSGAA